MVAVTMTPRGTAALTAYLVVAVTNVGSLALGIDTLANLTQWLLMPLLLAAFLVTPPAASHPLPRLSALTIAALAFSWLGDAAPDLTSGDASFLAMVGAFFVAQLCYIGAFRSSWRRSLASRSPALVLPYAVAFVVLVLACAPNAGPLLAPVVAYGLAVTVMAVLSTGLNRAAALGGALFMVSDSLIALGAFRDWGGRPLSVAIMATYAVAQLLLVAGIQAYRRNQPSPD